jgi:hypothetical protein
MPNGGFDLIALPLERQARENGNIILVDELSPLRRAVSASDVRPQPAL